MAESSGRQLPPAVLRLWERRAVAGPYAAAGAVSIIVGGLLASAIAAPAPTRHGVWAVAYLVLVMGIGQLVLGTGQALLALSAPSTRTVATGVVVFNVANIAILIGIVTDRIVVFDVGSLLLIVALVMFLLAVGQSDGRSWGLYGYRLLIMMLVVSVPIGMLVTTVGPH